VQVPVEVQPHTPGVPPPPQLSGDEQVPQLGITFPQLSTP